MSDRTELELVLLVASGDEVAFERLTSPHVGPWVRAARSLTGDFGDAEDVVFQVLQKLWERIRAGGEALADVRSYGLRMVRNTALNLVRSRQRANRHAESAAGAAEPFVDDTLDHVLARELRRALDSVVEALPEEDQRILELHVVRDLPFQEIATVLSRMGSPRTEAWARKRYQRAREALRKRARSFALEVSNAQLDRTTGS